MVYLQRVKARAPIHAHRKVLGLLEGEYAAVQVGRGMDFNDLREYVRGDDVKDIAWKASARSAGQLLVKRYVAERKHTVLLCVSTGRSMAALNRDDGAGEQVSKRDLAVFVAGLVGYLAVRHGDLVSLAYGDAAGQHLRPRESTEVHLERLLATVHDATTPEAAPSDLVALLHHVARTVRRRTILAIVSDEVTVSPELADVLRRLAVQHEILFLTIGDLDPTLPVAVGAPGVRRLRDIDTAAEVPGWLRGDRRLQQEYAELVGAEEQGLRRRLDQLGIVHERVRDTEAAMTAVFRALERHRHARRR